MKSKITSALAALLLSSACLAQTNQNASENIPTGRCLDAMLMNVITGHQHEIGTYKFKSAQVAATESADVIYTVKYQFTSTNGETKSLVYVGYDSENGQYGRCRLTISELQ